MQLRRAACPRYFVMKCILRCVEAIGEALLLDTSFQRACQPSGAPGGTIVFVDPRRRKEQACCKGCRGGGPLKPSMDVDFRIPDRARHSF